MGCTFSSLKGSDAHRDDLTNQDTAPRIVSEVSDYGPSTSYAPPDAVTTKSMQRRESSTKQMLQAYSHKTSSFSPIDSKRRSSGLSDEQMKKHTGMTRDELMAWGDKNIYRGKGPASMADGSGAGAMAIGLNNGMVGAF